MDEFARAESGRGYLATEFNKALSALEMLLKIQVSPPLSLDKLTSGWLLSLIDEKVHIHVKITSLPEVGDDVDTGHKDGETIVMVKWYDAENDELTGPEIPVITVHEDPAVDDEFDMYRPWGGTGHVYDEDGGRVLWKEVGGGGGLPKGQYQFMVFQMVTTNETGFDNVMSHAIREPDPGP